MTAQRLHRKLHRLRALLSLPPCAVLLATGVPWRLEQLRSSARPRAPLVGRELPASAWFRLAAKLLAWLPAAFAPCRSYTAGAHPWLPPQLARRRQRTQRPPASP